MLCVSKKEYWSVALNKKAPTCWDEQKDIKFQLWKLSSRYIPIYPFADFQRTIWMGQGYFLKYLKINEGSKLTEIQ